MRRRRCVYVFGGVRKHDYHNFLFSMKASNPLVMVQVPDPRRASPPLRA